MNLILYEKPRYKKKNELEKGQIIEAHPDSSIENLHQKFNSSLHHDVPIIGYVMGTSDVVLPPDYPKEQLLMGQLYPATQPMGLTYSYSEIERWTDNYADYRTIGTFTNLGPISEEQSNGLENLLFITEEERLHYGKMLCGFLETMKSNY
jgi:hypothetical protein